MAVSGSESWSRPNRRFSSSGLAVHLVVCALARFDRAVILTAISLHNIIKLLPSTKACPSTSNMQLSISYYGSQSTTIGTSQKLSPQGRGPSSFKTAGAIERDETETTSQKWSFKCYCCTWDSGYQTPLPEISCTLESPAFTFHRCRQGAECEMRDFRPLAGPGLVYCHNGHQVAVP